MSHPQLSIEKRRAHRQLALWCLAAMAACFLAMVCRLNEVTHDAFHEMALFREYWVTGEFPTIDSFAYTPTVAPVVHHEWGTGAVLYFVTTMTGLGLTGLTILKFSLMGLLWSMLYRVAKLRGVHPYLFAALSITVFPILWVGMATIRATLFTLVFLSIQLWMTELDRRGVRWWIVAWWGMLVVWLNMHAGFLVGVGLLGIYTCERWLAEWTKTRSLVTATSAVAHLIGLLPLIGVAMLFNPYGSQYVPYLLHAVRMPRPLIAEWGPLWTTHDPALTVCLFALSIALVAIALRRQPFMNWMGIVGLMVCAVLALKHLRHGPIYAVLWIAYAPAWLSHAELGRDMARWLPAHRQFALRVAQSVALLAMLWCVTQQFWQTTVSGDTLRQSVCYPIEATRYLKAHRFAGNLLTPFHAGSFMSWEMYPQVKVSLDGRYEVAYAPPVFDEHWDFFEDRGDWSRILERYPHDAILVNQNAKIRPKLETFREQGAWQFVYEDQAYAILMRRPM